MECPTWELLKGKNESTFRCRLTTENTKRNRENTEMEDNSITHKIIECAIKVHTKLGPGLLESAYKECLYYELKKAKLKVEKEKPFPLIYEEIKMDCGYRADFYVEDRIVVEIKAVDAIHDVHMAQALTYLKIAERRFGLLINFNVLKIKDGIRRIVNGY